MKQILKFTPKDSNHTWVESDFSSSFGPHLVAKGPPQLLGEISEFCVFYVFVIIMGYASDVPQNLVYLMFYMIVFISLKLHRETLYNCMKRHAVQNIKLQQNRMKSWSRSTTCLIHRHGHWDCVNQTWRCSSQRANCHLCNQLFRLAIAPAVLL
jgi:hypothetical protein